MQQKPFTLNDLTSLSSFLNQLVFRLLWEVPSVTGERLVLFNTLVSVCMDTSGLGKVIPRNVEMFATETILHYPHLIIV